MDKRATASLLIIVSVFVVLGIGLTKPTITKAVQPEHGQLASLGDNFNTWIATQAGFGPSATIVNQTVEVSFPANLPMSRRLASLELGYLVDAL